MDTKINQMDSFIKIYLLIFICLFIILVFVVPNIRVYKKTGINPFRFIKNHDRAHDYVEASMKIFILLILIAVIVYSFFDTVYDFFAPFGYLETRTLKVIGLIIGHISLMGIMIAQWQMRLSWRIGIDYENKTALVTRGFFKLSRNPIYLFLLTGLIGLFLIIPNAVTFAVLFASYLILQVTMRLEEEFLEKQHGEAYQQYKRKVRRLI